MTVLGRAVAFSFLAALGGCKDPSTAPNGSAVVEASVPAPGPEGLVAQSHRVMGTQVSVTLYTDVVDVAPVFGEVFREFDRLEALLTTWRKDSDVSRVNQAAGENAVPVRKETLEVIQRGLALGKMTSGKFDLTFGPLAKIWKFDHDKDFKLPRQEEVDAQKRNVNFREVAVDADAMTIKLNRRGMKIHLGGIGKGYAVDKVVGILRRRGFDDFMIQAGGDLYVSGTKGERKWRVGIRDPRGGPTSFFAAMEVSDATFSTSGDYERFFVKDGQRFHHILDPHTGFPATASRSVTVMAEDALTADVLSTAVFILGPKRGIEVIDALEGAGAVVVDRKNRVHVSARLKGQLKFYRDPTP